MENKKAILKKYLVQSPDTKRKRLESFINDKIQHEDIQKALNFLEEHNWSAKISGMSYSDQGSFGIMLNKEIGMTYLK